MCACLPACVRVCVFAGGGGGGGGGRGDVKNENVRVCLWGRGCTRIYILLLYSLSYPQY